MLIYQSKGEWGRSLSDVAHATAFNLIDKAKRGGQESSLDSLDASKETLRGLYGCHQPQRRIERSNQMTVFKSCPGVKCPSFLLLLLGILITSVWLQQPGFSQLFRATQKPLIGIHSGLQADSSAAPTLTITASREHSFSCYCALETAPIQSQHKWKYTGPPH